MRAGGRASKRVNDHVRSRVWRKLNADQVSVSDGQQPGGWGGQIRWEANERKCCSSARWAVSKWSSKSEVVSGY